MFIGSDKVWKTLIFYMRGPLMSNVKMVIVIDDSEAVRSKVGHWFKQREYSVVEAADGEEGYKKIKDNLNQLTLIVSDYNMPKMNGGELLLKLDKEGLGIDIVKVLLTTETPNKKTFDFTKINNFRGWILKPINEKKFLKVMEALGFFKV